MKKSVIRICITVTSVLVLATLAVLNLPVLLPGNFENAECVGNISVPKGYERISGNDQMYTDFLRSIPLKPKGGRGEALQKQRDGKIRKLCQICNN